VPLGAAQPGVQPRGLPEGCLPHRDAPLRDILLRADDHALHKLQRETVLLEAEDETLAMCTLWSPEFGLIRRRQSEPNLWRRGVNA
jgi:hypothetical protein